MEQIKLNITPLQKWVPNMKEHLYIAGPCAAESRTQLLNIAEELAGYGGFKIFRAGIWKPRTRPGNFEGIGEEGLTWLQEIKDKYGFLTTVEVAGAAHVELALKYNVDVLWIGARTTVNPFSVQEIADALKGRDIPVIVKNPLNADLSLWLGALERINNAGITRLAAVHRGFSSIDPGKYRFDPVWKIPVELKKRHPSLPIICDPSHIAGDTKLIANIAQKALDLDMSGLMIEVHNDPQNALSDRNQQLKPKEAHDLIGNLSKRKITSNDQNFEQIMEKLRNKIDRFDHELLELVHSRMNIVDEIANIKFQNNITPLQMKRFCNLSQNRIDFGKKLNLPKNLTEELFMIIHEESLRRQSELMCNLKLNKESSKS